MALNTNPASWVTNERPPASKMHTEIHDAIAGIQAGWDSWSPYLLATSSNPNLGSGGSGIGYMTRIGQTIDINGVLNFGSSGTAPGSGDYRVGLPIPALAFNTIIGSAVFLDSSAGAYYTAVLRRIGTLVAAVHITGTPGVMSASWPVVPSANDVIYFNARYQAA